jgi:hypothetical protein
MLKKNSLTFLLGGLLLLMTCLTNGQEKNSSSTSSPYSRFGIGTLSGYSPGRTEAMGGIGIGTRYNLQINAGNPASYTAIDSMSFLLDFGINMRNTTFQTSDGKNGSNNVNFDYLAFAFPIKGWWASAFGIMPLSFKGYNIQRIDSIQHVKSSTNFNGTGTLSKAFIGNAFNIGKHLSLGVNIWYLFGTLVDQTYIYLPNDASAYDYLSSNNLTVHNFGFTSGLQYKLQTNKKNTLVLGAVFEPRQSMSSSYTILEERELFRNSSTNTAIIDTIEYKTDTKNGLTLPVSYGAGFSYSVKNKMVFGADYYHQQWSEALFLGSSQQYLTNRSRYSAGFELTPNENSIKSYLARSKYRIGLFYENSYLMLNGKQINGYGLTFGLGLPFPRSFSSVNFSCELGQLGTKQNNLILESYAKFTLHFLFYDRWFMKRKFE